MATTFIAIAGNIGAGKTELTSFLARRYALTPFYEPNDENPYLDDFYRDMKQYAFRSQLFFLAHKFRLHQAVQAASGTVLLDRTIYEDAEIFAHNLYRTRAIEKRDWATYRALFEAIVAALKPPDVLVYLRCSVRTLKARIGRRGRTMESAIPTSYLKRLNTLYEDWVSRYTLSPVVVLQTDQLDYVTNLLDQADVLAQLEKHL